VEQCDAQQERDRRVEIGDDGRSHRADLADEREEEQEGSAVHTIPRMPTASRTRPDGNVVGSCGSAKGA